MEKKYKVILADPPWSFIGGLENRSVNNHYQTMSTEEICKLKIKEISDTDCMLFIWATFPKLMDAFEVIKSWGFEYKTVGFVWVKLTSESNKIFTGMGNWTRSNSEICLIATKGKPKRISRKVHQIVMSKIRKHSQKPQEIYIKIEELMGDIPRIELFARQHVDGWDVFGNQVENECQLRLKNRGDLNEYGTTNAE